ncbi:MAG: hypothetical protein KKA10_11670 [Euryarchaeota archaeon]|nr:hypothetical protein [Euryarchaeota archaeon]
MFEKIKNIFNKFDLEKTKLEEIESERIQIDRESERTRDLMRQKSEMRAGLFKQAVETTDELESEALAIKIENVEGEQTTLSNEHVELMSALRTMNGMRALKRKQKQLERFGIWGKIKNMDKTKIMEILGNAEAEQIISSENSAEISRLFGFQPTRVSSKRTDDIMKQINKARALKEEMGVDTAVTKVLKERDGELKKKSEEKLAASY